MLFNNVFDLFALETIILIVMFGICLKLIIARRKQKLMIENLNFYNKTLTNMYDGIRSMKHDYINFVQCLKGYTLCDDMGGVKEMVDSVYNESRDICNMEALNPKVINNPAIYNLLINKYQDAIDNNISMSVEIEIDLHEVNLDTYTLCRIIGILVDNAIEAAKNCNNKMVSVRFLQIKNYKSLFVENTYDDSIDDLSIIFKKGYSTKDEGHGLGLWKVRKIVDNNCNLKLKTYKNDLFTQELRITDKVENAIFSIKKKK